MCLWNNNFKHKIIVFTENCLHQSILLTTFNVEELFLCHSLPMGQPKTLNIIFYGAFYVLCLLFFSIRFDSIQTEKKLSSGTEILLHSKPIWYDRFPMKEINHLKWSIFEFVVDKIKQQKPHKFIIWTIDEWCDCDSMVIDCSTTVLQQTNPCVCYF